MRLSGANQYVYFMLCENFVKIGLTNGVQQRLRNLQIGCPFEIKLLGSIYCGDYGEDYETYLHEYLYEHHKSGEWFYYNNKVKEFIYRILKINIIVQPILINKKISKRISYEYPYNYVFKENSIVGFIQQQIPLIIIAKYNKISEEFLLREQLKVSGCQRPAQTKWLELLKKDKLVKNNYELRFYQESCFYSLTKEGYKYYYKFCEKLVNAYKKSEWISINNNTAIRSQHLIACLEPYFNRSRKERSKFKRLKISRELAIPTII